MNQKPAQEPYIRADALRLYRMYIDKDLAHNAHSLWLLAGDCILHLTGKYECHPLAIKYAINLVDYFSGQWSAAHPAA